MAKIGEGGSSRRKKRKLGDVVLRELAEKRVNLGNAGLTALWNQNPDNLEACRWALCQWKSHRFVLLFGNCLYSTLDMFRARDRDFLPSLQNYFEEAIEQLDPVNQVEDSRMI